MPIYEYECLKCGHQFEKIQRFSDPPPSKCPECNSKQVSQMLSAPAIQFKGTGWYVTDYAKKSSTEASSGKSNGKDRSTEKKSVESSETKSESKPTAGADASETPRKD